jgi:3',5'-cyclic AMP phosphodiesterase CpdA
MFLYREKRLETSAVRTIAHLSDLHFGRVDAALLEPLADFLGDVNPDLVVVSGDLTQRARSAEFIAARSFLDMLPAPKIIVPGNHDIPLHNVFRRFVSPLAKYQRYITEELEPFHVDEEIAVLGINTARSLTIKDGRVNQAQIERVRTRLSDLDGQLIKILVTHHPFDLPSHMRQSDLVGRAPLAMSHFSECGVDLLLAGHLHTSEAVLTSDRYKAGNFSALAIQAGTATSTRGRGESNSFNVLRIELDRVEIDQVSWIPDTGEFTKIVTQIFAATKNGWISSAS